jgi:hypothetical protein
MSIITVIITENGGTPCSTAGAHSKLGLSEHRFPNQRSTSLSSFRFRNHRLWGWAIARSLIGSEFPNPHHLRHQLHDVADQRHHSAFIPRKIDDMILAALGYWQRQPSQKRDGQFPNTEQSMARLSHELHRNNFMMSNLRRRLISWHAGCIECWYQPKLIL